MKSNYVFVFDLDDTLYKEIDFLKSAYRYIASIVDKNNSNYLYQRMLDDYYEGKNVFQLLAQSYNQFSIDSLLDLYRNHYPEISLDNEIYTTLNFLKGKGKTGLITDGRSITQRNKISALGLGNFFDKIIISEEVGYSKPDIRMFQQFHVDNDSKCFYIANDTSKDFLAPNQLGWDTVCLLDNDNINIRKQDFNLNKDYLPKIKIINFSELKSIVEYE